MTETISRTDEGQPRLKYIFNKCGTNIYFFTLQRFGPSPSPNFKKKLLKPEKHTLSFFWRLSSSKNKLISSLDEFSLGVYLTKMTSPTITCLSSPERCRIFECPISKTLGLCSPEIGWKFSNMERFSNSAGVSGSKKDVGGRVTQWCSSLSLAYLVRI